MKIILTFFAILCGFQFISAQVTRDESNILPCVVDAVEEFGIERIIGGAEFLVDLYRTVDSLIDFHRRCLEMAPLMRETCLVAWRAQVIMASTRLATELNRIALDDYVADFIEAFLACFDINPDDPDYPYRLFNNKKYLK